MTTPKTSKSRSVDEKDLGASLIELFELAETTDFRVLAKESLDAHNHWNIIVLVLTAWTVLVWMTPLGTLFNKVFKFNVAVVEKIDDAKEYVLPNFTEPPKIGEEIGGYKVTDLPGSPRQGGARKHQGTDIAMPVGTQLYVPDLAGEKAQIECIEYNYDPATQTPGSGGKEIGANLTTSYGIEIKYRHLTKCQEGLVGGGQVFALSGFPSAPHLHIEGWRDGQVISLQKEVLWWTVTGANPASKSGSSVTKEKPSATGNRLEAPTTGTFTQGYHDGHKGIDISNAVGTPIRSVADGTVIFAGWAEKAEAGLGNLVTVQGKDGTIYRYGHNEEILVYKGESVDAGDTIALMGSTGNSTGPHTHFEIEMGGSLADPCQCMTCPAVGETL